MCRVLFIGSNPSHRALSARPFSCGTKSSMILNRWIAQIQTISPQYPLISGVYYLNVSNEPTLNNKPLNKSDIVKNLDRLMFDINAIAPDKVVTLGKTAEQALTLLHIQHYAMPHPSGLNRKLNNENYVKEKIKGLQEYLAAPQ